MLALTGRKADGWLPSLFLLKPDAAYRKLGQVREAATAAGRDPDELTYAYNGPVLVDRRGGATGTAGPSALVGTPDHIADQLAQFARGGFTLLNLWPSGDRAEQRERLATKVVPAVRDRLS